MLYNTIYYNNIGSVWFKTNKRLIVFSLKYIFPTNFKNDYTLFLKPPFGMR